ncbi:Alpha/Beta hydrolase protein [Biscogniauxia mediterranea]|nr:Alpha/Beta hydrolase protein [Biscogniauxia mediterranea]
MVLSTVSLPPHNSHTHTVIFLHGRGAGAHEFGIGLLESTDARGRSLQHIFPSVRWVFPEAETTWAVRLGNEVSQWFDIWSPINPDERRELQVDGMRESTGKLIRLIQREACRVGLRNIVLAGHSQGCTLAVHALLNYPAPTPGTDEVADRMCALVGLSSWMSLGTGSPQGSREALSLGGAPPSNTIYLKTPVFLSHSADDNVIPIEQGRRLRDVLKLYGMNVTWKEYERGAHWIHGSRTVEDVIDFLKSQGLESAA